MRFNIVLACLLAVASTASALDFGEYKANLNPSAQVLMKNTEDNLNTLARNNIDLQDMLTAGICGAVNFTALNATYILCNQRELAKQVTYKDKTQ